MSGEKIMDTKTLEFITAFHFSVTFIWENNSVTLPFQSVTGISSGLQSVESLEEGGENRFVHRLPKPPKYENLKLTRALTGSDEILSWAEDAIYNFRIHPRTVLVSILNNQHEPVMSWSFVDAYPVKVSVTDLDAKKDEIAIQTLELTYKYSRRVQIKKKSSE